MTVFVTLLLLLFSDTAFSSCVNDCTYEPTCLELGYKQNINCPNGYIVCPLDSSYKWCKQYTCEDGRYKKQKFTDIGYECTQVNYHGHTCYDCVCNPPFDYIWNMKNAGQAILNGNKACNGNYSQCIPQCVGISVPDNNAEVTETCEACGNTYITGFKCKDGYQGDDCLTIKQCPAGSATSVDKCVSAPELGDEIVGYSGETPCYKCLEPSCEEGTSTDYNNPNNCGSSGSDGWISEATGIYIDGKQCYRCVAKTCPSEYIISPDDCVASGSKGFELNLNDPCYEGENIKYSCKSNGCESGLSSSYDSTEACTIAMRYASDIGVSYSQSTSDYDGNLPCYSCSCNCSAYSWTSSNVGDFGKVAGDVCCNGTNYASCIADETKLPTPITTKPTNSHYVYTTYTACNGAYIKDIATSYECNTGYKGSNCSTPQECPVGSATSADKCEEASVLGNLIMGYSGDLPCYECLADCEEGTSTDYDNPNNCGSSGSDGWTSEGTGIYIDGKQCYRCVAKTCSDTYKSYVSECGASGAKGYDLNTEQVCYAGDDMKYTCKTDGCGSGLSASYNSASACMNGLGYASTAGVTYAASSTDYDGNTPCYACSCNCSSSYPWTTSNVGTYGKVDGDVCCNGTNYSSCAINETKLPSAITVPDHGIAVETTYKACNDTQSQNVITDFVCEMNYVKNYNNKLCIPCTIGSVYHADGNCTEFGSQNYHNKTFGQKIPPIGVVFQINHHNQGTAGRVVALKDLKLNDGSLGYYAYRESIYHWWYGHPDAMNPYNMNGIPMTWGYAPSNYISPVSSNGGFTVMSSNGRATTELLIQYGLNSYGDTLTDAQNTPTAAMAARFLKLPEMYDAVMNDMWNAAEFMEGLYPGVEYLNDWYLPSLGELYMLSGNHTILNGTYNSSMSTYFAGKTNETLNNLANDGELLSYYDNNSSFFHEDQTIAEELSGFYISSNSYLNVSKYFAYNIDTDSVRPFATKAAPNINLKARAVMNFDKCPTGYSIYPMSKIYSPSVPAHYNLLYSGRTNPGLMCRLI
ncbi:MAG: hypothetical protein E7016_02915 [Alphaproteobacteria bacterium]|nr:hypothetical protein [Alphaproteobacteria bacterium]